MREPTYHETMYSLLCHAKILSHLSYSFSYIYIYMYSINFTRLIILFCAQMINTIMIFS